MAKPFEAGASASSNTRLSLSRLPCLPLRAETARAILAASESLDPDWLQQDHLKRLTSIDPGWSLAVECGATEPLHIIARLPWWPTLAPPAAEARDRLWLFSVATSCAARRLAYEAGLEDRAELLARFGLLHALGYWALASTNPDSLIELLATRKSEARFEQERNLIGQEAGNLGRDLALFWGTSEPLLDIAWLHEGPRLPGLDRLADPTSLALIRQARAWARKTPWGHGPPRETFSTGTADEARRTRWLVAAVQSRCTTSLAGSVFSPFEETLAKRLAAMLVEQSAARKLAAEHEQALQIIADTSSRSPDQEVPDHQPRDPLASAALTAHRQIQLSCLGWKQRADDLLRSLRTYRHKAASATKRDRLTALAEFAAGAGHELNNPLAVIMGRAQLLIGQTTGPEVHRSLRTIVAQAQRAHRILRDLMYVARPTPVRPRRCQPDSILFEAVRDLQREAETRGVRLMALPADGPAAAWCDADALRHVADILIRNALEATPQGRLVRIKGQSTPESLSWEVADEGSGLSTQAARKLLDPFYCGREAGRGLGLGLSRAARFISLSGGDLTWRHAPGGGTIFRVHLPLAPIPEKQVAAQAASPPPDFRATG